MKTRFDAFSQVLHWLTAVLVLVAFLYGPGGSETRVYAAARDAQRQWHETLGLCVLGLSVLRVLWRLVAARPTLPLAPPWQTLAAKAVQGLLYALLFILPLTAITGAWLEGHPLTLLGGVQVAPLLAASHDRGAVLAEVHGWLGDAILWLAGLHALAALYHHYLLRDGVLSSMLPPWLTRSR